MNKETEILEALNEVYQDAVTRKDYAQADIIRAQIEKVLSGKDLIRLEKAIYEKDYFDF